MSANKVEWGDPPPGFGWRAYAWLLGFVTLWALVAHLWGWR